MTFISPFRGVTFHRSFKDDIGDQLCPPFDMIESKLREDLYETSEFNVVRLENGKSFDKDDAHENKYKRASAYYRSWLHNQILVQEIDPCYYILEERFKILGRERTRKSLIASVAIGDGKDNGILLHENTREKQKNDRLKLMQATEANFSPIMSLIEDRDSSFMNLLEEESIGTPIFEGSIPSMHDFKLWRTSKDLGAWADAEKIFIADGHHRYETALKFAENTYSDALVNPARLRMMNLVSMQDSGLFLLGYHRAFSGIDSEKLNLLERGLREKFEFSKCSWSDSFYEWQHNDGDKILFATNSDLFILTLRPDIIYDSIYEIIHQVFDEFFSAKEIINHIRYEHEPKFMMDQLNSNKFQACFLMNALSKEYFVDTVSRGNLLPSKSTFFYPKLPSGIVIQDIYNR